MPCRAGLPPEQVEKIRAARRDYYRRNKEKELAKAKLWNQANPEKRAAYFKKWMEENREAALESRARRTEANRERITALNAAWSRANLDRHRAHQQNRRARKQANGGRLSPDIVERLFALQRGKCACCGVPLGDSYDLDHIVPLVRGGANSDENVQLLTARCNRQKGASDPIAFMQRRGRLL